MSGIFGYISADFTSPLCNLLSSMREELPAQTPTIFKKWISHNQVAGLAVEVPIHLQHVRSAQLAVDDEFVCLTDGVIYQSGQGYQSELIEPRPAHFLLQHYKMNGLDGLKSVNGSFVVAWWHKREKRLVLATDKIGYRHLYYAIDGKQLYFSSSLGRIPALLSSRPRIDEEAFSDLLRYRHILGERTLLKEIKLVPVGGAIIFDEEGHLDRRSYWHSSEIEPYGRYDSARLDELTDIFVRAVKRSFQPASSALLTLTGGLDSRVILAAAVNQNLDFATLTDGDLLGTDVKIARALSHHLGITHHSQPIHTHLLGEQLRPMAQRQGGMVATIDSHPCQYAQFPLPGEVVVAGITGETARSPWVQWRDLSQNTLEHATQLVERSVISPLARKIDLASLWNQSWRQVGKSAPKEHMIQVVGGYNYLDTPLMAADYYGLDEHTRKFLNKGSLVALDSVEVMIPYIDHEWITAIMSVPLSERVKNTIQVDMIKRLCPDLTRFPTNKMRLPLDTPKWRTNLSIFTTQYWGKVSRALGHHDSRKEIPTYNYLAWSRNEMRSSLESLLLNESAIYRDLLDEKIVREMLQNHFSGSQNWPHLVAALTILELTHSLWIDNSN